MSKCKRIKTGAGRCGRGAALLLVVLTLFGLSAKALAADVARTEEIGRFQVVSSGSVDKAYLVDTVTGATWVLTHRTLAMGTEPIAIPYKFIQKTPKNQGEFLVESAGPNSSLPSGAGREK